MEVVFVLVVVSGIVALIVKGIQGYNLRIAEAWSDAATQLGMGFTPGSLMHSKSIDGQLYGNRVEVSTFTKGSGQSSTTYTRYRIYYPESLGLGLHLKQQGFMAGVAAFFGSQDIEVGDPRFDAQVVVKGTHPGRVAEFLTPSRRLRILRLFQNHPECKISDHVLEWSKKGNEKQAEQIVGTVRRLALAATRLCASSESGQSLDLALEAQREGRLDEALRHVRDTPASGDETDPDVSILEGQILEASGRETEAAEVFERASRDSPEDEELSEWARGKRGIGEQIMSPTAPTPEPVPEPVVPEVEVRPPAPEPAPESIVQAPEPDAPVVEPPTAAETTGVDVATICEDLFASGVMSFQAKRRFDERYKNLPVRWSGELRQVSPYHIDLVFKGDPGTKMVLDVHEVVGGAFGRTAQAIVQLPQDALEGLRTRIGERIVFEGQLLSCDILMRNFYVGGAKLV